MGRDTHHETEWDPDKDGDGTGLYVPPDQRREAESHKDTPLDDPGAPTAH